MTCDLWKVCLSVVLLSWCARADTRWTIDITEGTVWYAANSPYWVDWMILVTETAVLNIEAGTEVRFNSSAAGIRVDGQVVALGRPDARINFTSGMRNPASGDWAGVELTALAQAPNNTDLFWTSSGSIFRFADVFYARTAFRFASRPAFLSNVRVSYSSLFGVYFKEVVRPLSVDSCLFSLNVATGSVALYGESPNSLIYIFNTTFVDNVRSIYIKDTPPAPAAILLDQILVTRTLGNGVYFENTRCDITVQNSVFRNTQTNALVFLYPANIVSNTGTWTLQRNTFACGSQGIGNDFCVLMYTNLPGSGSFQDVLFIDNVANNTRGVLSLNTLQAAVGTHWVRFTFARNLIRFTTGASYQAVKLTLLCGANAYGACSIRDNVFDTNLLQQELLNVDLTGGYIEIVNNTFRNNRATSLISLGLRDNNVRPISVQSNTFVGNTVPATDGYISTYNANNANPALLFINYNSFDRASPNAIYLRQLVSASDRHNFANVTYNWWGSPDEEGVRTRIYDTFRDVGLMGARYDPWLVADSNYGQTLVPIDPAFPRIPLLMANGEFGGEVGRNYSLPASACPLFVNRSIFITNGAYLDIEAGCQLSFGPRNGIRVDVGALRLLGTNGLPVTLLAAAGKWLGISFGDNAYSTTMGDLFQYVNGSVLTYTTIRNVGAGSVPPVAIRGSAGNVPLMDNVEIFNCEAGAVHLSSITQRMVSITNSLFTDSSSGNGVELRFVSQTVQKGLRVLGSTFRRNSQHGLVMGFANSNRAIGQVWLNGNTFESNGQTGLRGETSYCAEVAFNTFRNQGQDSLYWSQFAQTIPSGCNMSIHDNFIFNGGNGWAIYFDPYLPFPPSFLNVSNNFLLGNQRGMDIRAYNAGIKRYYTTYIVNNTVSSTTVERSLRIEEVGDDESGTYAMWVTDNHIIHARSVTNPTIHIQSTQNGNGKGPVYFARNVICNNTGTTTVLLDMHADPTAKFWRFEYNSLVDNIAVPGGYASTVVHSGCGFTFCFNFFVNPVNSYEIKLLTSRSKLLSVNGTRNFWTSPQFSSQYNQVATRVYDFMDDSQRAQLVTYPQLRSMDVSNVSVKAVAQSSGLNYLNDDPLSHVIVFSSVVAHDVVSPLGSPYNVTGDIYVNTGVVLTIPAGVTLCFMPGKSLFVNGTLIAIGTPDQQIIFSGCMTGTGVWSGTDRNPNSGTWGGISFLSGAQGGVLSCSNVSQTWEYQYGSILRHVAISGPGDILGTSVPGIVSTSFTPPLLHHISVTRCRDSCIWLANMKDPCFALSDFNVTFGGTNSGGYLVFLQWITTGQRYFGVIDNGTISNGLNSIGGLSLWGGRFGKSAFHVRNVTFRSIPMTALRNDYHLSLRVHQCEFRRCGYFSNNAVHFTTFATSYLVDWSVEDSLFVENTLGRTTYALYMQPYAVYTRSTILIQNNIFRSNSFGLSFDIQASVGFCPELVILNNEFNNTQGTVLRVNSDGFAGRGFVFSNNSVANVLNTNYPAMTFLAGYTTEMNWTVAYNTLSFVSTGPLVPCINLDVSLSLTKTFRFVNNVLSDNRCPFVLGVVKAPPGALDISYNQFNNSGSPYELYITQQLPGVSMGQPLFDQHVVPFNWWGSADDFVIRRRIYDFYDSPHYYAVTYWPQLLSPNGPSASVQVVENDYFMSVPGAVGGMVDATTTLVIDSPGYPLVVDRQIYVPPGATLVINKGVTLLFGANLGILVEGTLLVEGTSAERVMFSTNKTARPTQGSWGRVMFNTRSRGANYSAEGSYMAGSRLLHLDMRYGGYSAPINVPMLNAYNWVPFLQSINITFSSGHCLQLDAIRSPTVILKDVSVAFSQAGWNGAEIDFAGSSATETLYFLWDGGFITKNPTYGIEVTNLIQPSKGILRGLKVWDNGGYGLWLSNLENFEVQSCDFQRTDSNAIRMVRNVGGRQFVSGQNATIRDCNFTAGNAFAIYTYGNSEGRQPSSGTYINRNSFTNTRGGIQAFNYGSTTQGRTLHITENSFFKLTVNEAIRVDVIPINNELRIWSNTFEQCLYTGVGGSNPYVVRLATQGGSNGEGPVSIRYNYWTQNQGGAMVHWSQTLNNNAVGNIFSGNIVSQNTGVVFSGIVGSQSTAMYMDTPNVNFYYNHFDNPLAQREFVVMTTGAARVINASSNWWGTLAPATIAIRVYDNADDTQQATLRYMPFLLEPLFLCDQLNNCSNGHGLCSAPNECSCYPGWKGADCSQFDCTLAFFCYYHGNCTGPNQCTCNAEYMQPFCQYASCTERQQCHGRGACYSPEVCTCDVGFTGVNCERCDVGFWGNSTHCHPCTCAGDYCNATNGVCSSCSEPCAVGFGVDGVGGNPFCNGTHARTCGPCGPDTFNDGLSLNCSACSVCGASSGENVELGGSPCTPQSNRVCVPCGGSFVAVAGVCLPVSSSSLPPSSSSELRTSSSALSSSAPLSSSLDATSSDSSSPSSSSAPLSSSLSPPSFSSSSSLPSSSAPFSSSSVPSSAPFSSSSAPFSSSSTPFSSSSAPFPSSSAPFSSSSAPFPSSSAPFSSSSAPFPSSSAPFSSSSAPFPSSSAPFSSSSAPFSSSSLPFSSSSAPFSSSHPFSSSSSSAPTGPRIIDIPCHTSIIDVFELLYGHPPALQPEYILRCTACVDSDVRPIWGTEWFTLDSDFCSAAKHTTDLMNGEFVTEFRLDKLEPEPRQLFLPSESNSITSRHWDQFYPIIYRVSGLYVPEQQSMVFVETHEGLGNEGIQFNRDTRKESHFHQATRARPLAVQRHQHRAAQSVALPSGLLDRVRRWKRTGG